VGNGVVVVTTPFQPADGERARWCYCYDLVLSRKPGDGITYAEVMELLDVDHMTALAVMREAKRHLEIDRQQTVRTVPKFGWVILDARGNLSEMEARRKKRNRAAEGHARLVVATPRDDLTQIDKARLDFEKKNALAALGLAGRKTKSFTELERESQRSERPELPLGKGEAS